MSTLFQEVRRTLGLHRLIPPGSRVVVALSGGADSVGLLLVLRELAGSERFALVGAAHLNHQLRGVDADRDEEFCRRLTRPSGIPIDVERTDVAARASDQGVSLEQAAHAARHEFFARSLARLDGTIVAVGHTRDDQAETFLLRLLRGAGPRGLSGMHPRSGQVVRPFIETSRAAVRAFLQDRGAEYCEDASNADLTIPRNRVRHELLPFLEARFSPAIVAILAREASIARDDVEFLETAAHLAAGRIVTRTVEGLEIDVPALLGEPAAVSRRVILAAQQAVSEGRFIGFDDVEAVRALMVSKPKSAADLPGHRANRRGERIVLTKSSGRSAGSGHRRRGKERIVAGRGCRYFSYELRVPGEAQVVEAGCAISAALETVPPGDARGWPLASRGDRVVIDAGNLVEPLVVRNRRPGDVFGPLGLQGHKKLQDFFVDRKIDRRERDAVPLIINSQGQIVWVVGHAVAEDFRVTDRTTAVVILKRVPVPANVEVVT